MSVRRCQQEVDRRELHEWMALFEHEPWGEHREDVRMATVATLLANIMSLIVRLGGGKPSRSYGIRDFLPHAPARPQQTPEQAKAIMGLFLRTSGALN
jgi:hypothetical protein